MSTHTRAVIGPFCLLESRRQERWWCVYDIRVHLIMLLVLLLLLLLLLCCCCCCVIRRMPLAPAGKRLSCMGAAGRAWRGRRRRGW